MSNKILHILMTDYNIDSRVRNETSSLQKDGYDVTVFCLRSNELPNDEVREGVKLVRCGLIGGKLLTFFSAYFSMIIKSFGLKAKSVHAHDVTALPVAFVISRLKRIPLIYDSHELWSQSHHAVSSKLLINTVATVEKYLASKAARVITVSDSIKIYLEKHFNVKDIAVVRNIPSYTHEGEYNLFREKYSLGQNTKICIYQGLMSKSRGVHLVAEAALSVVKQDIDCAFFFLGDGGYLNELKQLIEENDMSSKIYAIGSIEQNELLKYTKSADIGIHAITNSCLNHDYCLPNKIFEYIHSGLVVVMTDLTELKRFIDTNGIGLTFRDGDAESLREGLVKLLTDDALFRQCKENSEKIAQSLTWDNEYKVLQSIYKSAV